MLTTAITSFKPRNLSCLWVVCVDTAYTISSKQYAVKQCLILKITDLIVFLSGVFS